MARAISVTIGNQRFSKKDDLTKFVQNLVNKYQIGEYLNEDDTTFCMLLFQSHSDYPNKLSPGVKLIQVLIQEKGTKGFQIHKIDGSSDNISWTDCIANRK